MSKKRGYVIALYRGERRTWWIRKPGTLGHPPLRIVRRGLLPPDHEEGQ